MTRLYQPLKLWLIAAGLITAIVSESRLAISAYLLRNPTMEMALHAARFSPADEDIFIRLADLDPGSRGTYLRTASALNPYDARPWLDLGFLAEMNEDATKAGLDFREAARLDRRAAPAWALANFYFLQGDKKSFYFWGSQYRQAAGGDAVGLYRLAWGRDPHVAALIRDFSPMTCKEMVGMDGFLASRAAPSDLAQLDQFLASCPDKEALRSAVLAVSRLLLSDRSDLALHLWNELNSKDTLGDNSPSLSAARTFTNLDFANQLDGRGFNWHVNQTPGILVRRLAQRQSAEFSFDGSEPEVSTLLFKPVVLVAGTRYQVTCRIDSKENHETGFSWRLVELSTGKTLQSGVGKASNRHDGFVSWTFQAPPTSRTLVLAFTYVRPDGDTKMDGIVTLSDLKLDPNAD